MVECYLLILFKLSENIMDNNIIRGCAGSEESAKKNHDILVEKL